MKKIQPFYYPKGRHKEIGLCTPKPQLAIISCVLGWVSKIERYMGCSSVVENLPNMHEALDLIYSMHVYAPCMCDTIHTLKKMKVLLVWGEKEIVGLWAGI